MTDVGAGITEFRSVVVNPQTRCKCRHSGRHEPHAAEAQLTEQGRRLARTQSLLAGTPHEHRPEYEMMRDGYSCTPGGELLTLSEAIHDLKLRINPKASI